MKKKNIFIAKYFQYFNYPFCWIRSSPFLDTDPDPAPIFDTNTVTDPDIFYGSAPLGNHSELDREEKMCHLCRDV